MSLENLYREVIIDHYRNPRNTTPLTDPDGSAEGVNPLCGDEITVQIRFRDDVIEEISVHGTGCSISQASASMMSLAVKGKTREEIKQITRSFKQLLDVDSEETPNDIPPDSRLGELEALSGVREYPVRIKCATLAWNTLAEALEASEVPEP